VIIRRVLAVTVTLGCSACGYHLVGGGNDPAGPFAVRGASAQTPYAATISAVEAGARAELARAGELAGCTPESGTCSFVEIEVVRVDESSEGISVAAAHADEPLARGMRFSVTGRALLRRTVGGPIERDTGDVRTTEVVARSRDPAAEVALRETATQRAGRRLGARLVHRILGFPDPPDD
jgi:hypothetical protein